MENRFSSVWSWIRAFIRTVFTPPPATRLCGRTFSAPWLWASRAHGSIKRYLSAGFFTGRTRLGYLVWGEYGNWGLDHSNPAALGAMLTPWLEAVARDFNSPSVIGWCPFNETWDYKGRHQEDSVILSVYKATKALDPTRPVIDTSGNYHTQTDLYDVHDYEQDVDTFAAHYAPMEADGPVYDWCGWQHYGGQPYWVSEYGGILWDSHQEGGWATAMGRKVRRNTSGASLA